MRELLWVGLEAWLRLPGGPSPVPTNDTEVPYSWEALSSGPRAPGH